MGAAGEPAPEIGEELITRGLARSGALETGAGASQSRGARKDSSPAGRSGRVVAEAGSSGEPVRVLVDASSRDRKAVSHLAESLFRLDVGAFLVSAEGFDDDWPDAVVTLASPAYVEEAAKHGPNSDLPGAGFVLVLEPCEWRSLHWLAKAIPLQEGRPAGDLQGLQRAARELAERIGRVPTGPRRERTAQQTKRGESAAQRTKRGESPAQTSTPAQSVVTEPSIDEVLTFEEPKGPVIVQERPQVADADIAGIANDDPASENDVLEMTADVRALGALVAAKATKPPLSIGLFGDWGSGKTHFMNRLAEFVEQTSNSEGASASGPYHARVVQIRFNAWNYVDGNLWASLVHHLFANLRVPGDEDGKARGELLGRIQGKEVELAASRTEIEERTRAEREARAAASAAESERARQAGSLASAIASVARAELKRPLDALAAGDEKAAKDALARLKLPERALDSTRALESELRRASGLSRRVRALLAGTRERALAGVALAVSLAVGVGVALAGAIFSWPAVASAIASIVGAVGVALAALSRGLSRVDGWIGAVEKANERLVAAEAKVAEESRARATAAFAKLEESTRLVREETARATKLATELETLRAKLAETSAARKFEAFVEERAASDEYRRRLGLLATVREDFARLSDLMVKGAHEADGRVVTQPEAQRVERIVLYIDDLDRCPPARVVEVLEAVHLLLAFPLFVVVVAVDSRWVTRALAKRYGDMLAEEDGAWDSKASPLDYLEKIFQVPIWVRPLGREGSRRLVASLVGGESVTLTPTGHGRLADSTAAEPNPDLNVARPPEAKAAAKSTVEEPQKPADVARLLDLTEDERSFLAAVGHAAARSPRALKRFVNCYRLLRVRHRAADLAAFLDASKGPPPYQRVAVALALVVGAPRAARTALGRLDDGDATTLGAFLGASVIANSTMPLSEKERARIDALLATTAARPVLDLPARDMVEAAHLAWRYSFAFDASAASAQ